MDIFFFFLKMDIVKYNDFINAHFLMSQSLQNINFFEKKLNL